MLKKYYYFISGPLEMSSNLQKKCRKCDELIKIRDYNEGNANIHKCDKHWRIWARNIEKGSN